MATTTIHREHSFDFYLVGVLQLYLPCGVLPTVFDNGPWLRRLC